MFYAYRLRDVRKREALHATGQGMPPRALFTRERVAAAHPAHPDEVRHLSGQTSLPRYLADVETPPLGARPFLQEFHWGGVCQRRESYCTNREER